MAVIYFTTNLVNNKIYIGQQDPFTPGYFGSGKNIIRAIKKYGKENFNKVILEVIEDNTQLDIIGDRETYYIWLYNSRDPKIGYNIALGGGGSKGHVGFWRNKKLSKEHIEKLRISHTGHKDLPETKEKKRIAILGKPNLKNRGKAPWNKNKKGCYTEEQINNIRIGSLNRPPTSDESREKNRIDTTNRWKDPIYKEKVRKKLRGQKRTAATREKQRKKALLREQRKRELKLVIQH